MQENDNKISELSERFLDAMVAIGVTPAKFHKDTGTLMQTITKIRKGEIEPSKKLVKLLSETYGANPAWIYTGQGDMISGDKTGDIKNSNVNKGSGNLINVELPSSGQQKIIKPNGTVEIQSLDGHQSDARIADLERIVALKDEVIEAKNNEIETLKAYIEMLKNINK